ncbi:CdiA family toxin C-terminal domain-containing protein [Corallococcus sicarius]|uniref:Bacterial EndoU nuclease domain-containing protein n=1 Tax=Corallococcus sicarius TaxID=2316726 RepID=A0A3A8MG00_9BACT|nr:CdiA family toxin C-terminal domain-containing protein [Corallococcus sicarius]RKH30119.1 hypothetical protein D7X12_39280 [Corallococcus sicarius]
MGVPTSHGDIVVAVVGWGVFKIGKAGVGYALRYLRGAKSADEVARALKGAPGIKEWNPTSKELAELGESMGENGELRETFEALTRKRPVVNFASDLNEHLRLRDFSVPRKRGIGGAHNLDEFMKHSSEVNILRTESHPSVSGVKKIYYQMPALDHAGVPSGAWKAQIFEKTVYDPGVISDARFVEMGRQAAQNAKDVGGKLSREWLGKSDDGVEFRGYLNENGEVRSFFPESW